MSFCFFGLVIVDFGDVVLVAFGVVVEVVVTISAARVLAVVEVEFAREGSELSERELSMANARPHF